jgi:hypothetical protein
VLELDEATAPPVPVAPPDPVVPVAPPEALHAEAERTAHPTIAGQREARRARARRSEGRQSSDLVMSDTYHGHRPR